MLVDSVPWLWPQPAFTQQPNSDKHAAKYKGHSPSKRACGPWDLGTEEFEPTTNQRQQC
ncbi:MAG TPA: hypothetical protein VIH59_34760 [Candidatus Tectomicrobia bacterium]